jgi:hypothetical protein
MNIKDYTSLVKEKSREKCRNYKTFWDRKGILNDG